MSEINWKPCGEDLDDDAYAIWGGLMLRAEQMDRRVWWWCVYDNEGNRGAEQLAVSYDKKPFHATTAKRARDAAEAAAREIVASRE